MLSWQSDTLLVIQHMITERVLSPLRSSLLGTLRPLRAPLIGSLLAACWDSWLFDASLTVWCSPSARYHTPTRAPGCKSPSLDSPWLIGAFLFTRRPVLFSTLLHLLGAVRTTGVGPRITEKN